MQQHLVILDRFCGIVVYAMFLYKVVYVLRNPKDQLVSMYNFFKNLPVREVEPFKSMLCWGWDKFFDHTVAGKFLLEFRSFWNDM